MDTEELFKLFGYFSSWIVSGAAGAALFRFFGGKWVENIFAKDLEGFKAQTLHEFDLLLTRKNKWHEKEHEVLSKCWIKLVNAHRKLKQAMMSFREMPDLDRMSEQDLRSFAQRNNLSEYESEYLLSQKDKMQAYSKILDMRDLNSAHTAFVEFHTYFEDNKIFLSPDIKDKFLAADDYIWSAWVSQKMSTKPYNTKIDYYMKAYDTENEKIKPLILEIELLLQEKLFPKDKKPPN